MPDGEHPLSARQQALATRWLGKPELIADLSWGLVDTRILHVRARGAELIIKAAGPRNHHIGREITAHLEFTGPLLARDLAARMRFHDRDANILVTDYLAGELVVGTGAEWDPDTYQQAGEILRLIHDQGLSRVDDTYEQRLTDQALTWLDRDHRIDPSLEAAARRQLAAYRPTPVTLVPTHGDWHARNWLIDSGRVTVIDFGRAEMRPAQTDLTWLATQQWRGRADLEREFFDGYGADPREHPRWGMDLLRASIGTATWAYQVGDAEFEAHGLKLLAEALDTQA